VPKKIKHPDYTSDGIPRSERTVRGRNNIDILDKAGQEGMRKVCRLAREVLDIAAAAVRPGVTTDYIDDIVHEACLERDVSRYTGLFHRLLLTNSVVSLAPQLLQLPKIGLYITERGHLPRYSR
jgi:hypothetical protein